MSIIRKSFGIAICRNNTEENKRTEILMVRKRCTYYFFDFVHGNYYMDPDNVNNIQFMLNNMTVSEKISIMSYNFFNMWNMAHVCTLYKHENLRSSLDILKRENYKYTRCKNIFERHFGSAHDQKVLHKLILNSSSVDQLWEIPKGQQNDRESPVDCAKREVYEETNMSTIHYTFIDPAIYRNIFHTCKENNIVYESTYFIGIIKDDISIDSVHMKDIAEIDDVRWMSKIDIKALKIHHQRKKDLLSIFDAITSGFKYILKRLPTPERTEYIDKTSKSKYSSDDCKYMSQTLEDDAYVSSVSTRDMDSYDHDPIM